jgi:hypothetical protein
VPRVAARANLSAVLFIHEVHQVAGAGADTFEALHRDRLAPALAGTDDTRLLWFLHQTHGTGPAYTYVTVIGAADHNAWGTLGERSERGDLRDWAGEVDALRHESRAKVLEPVPWSPLAELDLATVPAMSEHADPDATLFMEDTAWPHQGARQRYLDKAGTLYLETLRKGRGLLELVAAFTPAFGTGRHREVVLWQRVNRPELLLPLLTREVPPEHRAPGTWMHDALEVRDRWRSRLLRVAPWSPLH